MDVRLGVAGGMKRVCSACSAYSAYSTYSTYSTYSAYSTCSAYSACSTCSCAPVGEPSVRLIDGANLGAASNQRGDAPKRHH